MHAWEVCDCYGILVILTRDGGDGSECAGKMGKEGGGDNSES